MRVCIVGIGGFGRETLACALDTLGKGAGEMSLMPVFMVDDEHYQSESVHGVTVIRRSEFEPELFRVLVAIGDPSVRQRVVESLPSGTRFGTLVHPTVTQSRWVEFGEGTIVTAGTILTCDIQLGRHTHLNLQTTVGHDCTAGDFFTTAPGVNISGDCTFGDRVYLGTNAAVKQGVTVCSDVTIGMGSIVLDDIDEPGVYVGSPVRRLRGKD